jgi:hypothetical protein
MKITFTNTMGVHEEYSPKPASSFVPDWYKNLESYTNGEKKPSGDGNTTATIKRCMPVFDAIVSGYIITTYTDIFVSQKPTFNQNGEKTGNTIPWYEWPSFAPIGWHPLEQAPTHPNKNNLSEGGSYPKFINPWSIQTPPGYSVLFTAPMHRESVFTILDGVVDTDKYTAPVNFPFVLNDWKFEGLIPAGTPVAQVIPFKRDSWEIEIGQESHLTNQNKITGLLRSRFFDTYKIQYRQTKEYK